MRFVRDDFLRLLKRRLKRYGMSVEKPYPADFSDLCGVRRNGFSVSVDFKEAKNEFDENGGELALNKLLEKLDRNFRTMTCEEESKKLKASLLVMLFPEGKLCGNFAARRFSGSLYSVLVARDKDGFTPVIREDLRLLDVPEAVAFAVGEKNLGSFLACSEMTPKDGAAINAWELSCGDSRLTASLAACPEFYEFCREKAGARFLVSVPSSDRMMIFPDVTNDRVEFFGREIVSAYKSSANPLSTGIYMFAPDGISVSGAFSLDVGKGDNNEKE